MSSKNRKSKTKSKSSSLKKTNKREWTDDSDDDYDENQDMFETMMMEHCMNSALGYPGKCFSTLYDNYNSREHATTSKQMASKNQSDKSPCEHPTTDLDLTACDANKIAQKYNYESFGRKHNYEINKECDICNKHRTLNSIEPPFNGIGFISTTDGNESDETEDYKLLFYDGWQRKESKMKVVQSVFNKKQSQENLQERSKGEVQNVDSMFADLYGTSKKKKKKNTAVAALAMALHKTTDSSVTDTPSISKDINVPKMSTSTKNLTKNSAENMKPDDNLKNSKTPIVDEKTQLILNFQTAVREGTEFFLKSEFSRCVDIYKRVRKDFAEDLRNICSVQDLSLVTYVFCLSRSLSHSYEEMIASLHDLVDLPTSFPLRLYGIALTYQRLNRHGAAMPHLRAALDSSPGPSAQTLYYPYCYCRYLSDTAPGSAKSSKKEPTKDCSCTLVPIPESNPDHLKATLESMLRECSMPRPATARCKYADCLKISTHEVPSQLIFTTDPDFSGYVRVYCEERCRIDYHHQCWKAYKDSTMDIGVKISDKDFLGKDCPTDGCKTDQNSTSCIIKINIHGADNEIKSSQTKPSTGVLVVGGGKKTKEEDDDKVATAVGKKKRNRVDSAESSPMRNKSKKKELVLSEKSKKKEASATKRKDVAEDEKSKEAEEEEAAPRKRGKHRKVKFSCVDNYSHHGAGNFYIPSSAALKVSQARKNPVGAARDFLCSLEEELELLQVLRLSRFGVPDAEWTDVSQDWLGNEELLKDHIINERYSRTLSPGEELVFDIYRCHLKEQQCSLEILRDHLDRKKTFWNLSWTPDGEILPSLDKIGGFKTISQFLTSSSEFVIIGNNLCLAENVNSWVESSLLINDFTPDYWWHNFECLIRYNDDKDSDGQILVHIPRVRQVDHSKLQAHFSMFGQVKLMSSAMVTSDGSSSYIRCPQDPESIWFDLTSELNDTNSDTVLITFTNPSSVRTALQYSKYDVNPVCSLGKHLYCKRKNQTSCNQTSVENVNASDRTNLQDFVENSAQLVSVENECSVSSVEVETESAASVVSISYDEEDDSYDEDDVTNIETDAENIDSVKDTLCDETDNGDTLYCNKTENLILTHCDGMENVDLTSRCDKTKNVEQTQYDETENVEHIQYDETENVEETCDKTENVEHTQYDETENVEHTQYDETENVEETCNETENVEHTQYDETENVGHTQYDEIENEEETCNKTENVEHTQLDETKNVEETSDETENVKETCNKTENVEETRDKTENIEETCDKTENVEETQYDETENVEETCDETQNVKETCDKKENVEETCDEKENVEETCDKTENVEETQYDETENVEETCDKTENVEETCDETQNVKETCDKKENVEETCDEKENVEETCDKTENVEETQYDETENVEETCDKTENVEETCDETENVEETRDKTENVEETCDETENVEETCGKIENVGETLCDKTENVEHTQNDETENVGETLCDKTESVEHTQFDKTENVEQTLCDKTESVELIQYDETENVLHTQYEEAENVEQTLYDKTESVKIIQYDEIKNVNDKLRETENIGDTLSDKLENLKDTACGGVKKDGENLCDTNKDQRETLSDKIENNVLSSCDEDIKFEHKLCDETVKDTSNDAVKNEKNTFSDEVNLSNIDLVNNQIEDGGNNGDEKKIEALSDIDVASNVQITTIVQTRKCALVPDITAEGKNLAFEVDNNPNNEFYSLNNDLLSIPSESNLSSNKIVESVVNNTNNRFDKVCRNNLLETDCSKIDPSNDVYSEIDHLDVSQTYLLEIGSELQAEMNIDQTKQLTDPILINESNISQDISDELDKDEIKETPIDLVQLRNLHASENLLEIDNVFKLETQSLKAGGCEREHLEVKGYVSFKCNGEGDGEIPNPVKLSRKDRDAETFTRDQANDQPTVESSNPTAENPSDDSTSEEMVVRNQYLNEIKNALIALSESEKNNLLCKVQKWSDRHGETDDDHAISEDESDNDSSDGDLKQTVIQTENTAKSGEYLSPPPMELTNVSFPEFIEVTSNRDILNTSNHVNIPEFESQASSFVTQQEFPQTRVEFTPWGYDTSSESEYFDDFVEDLTQNDLESTLDIDCEKNENHLEWSAMQNVEENQHRTEELLSCGDKMETTAQLSFNDKITHPQPQRICRYKLDTSSSENAKLAQHEIISNLEKEIKNLKQIILDSRKFHCDFILQSQSEQCLSKLAQWDIFRSVFCRGASGAEKVWRRLDREDAEWETRMRRAREQAEEVKREYNAHLTSLDNARGADLEFSLLRRPRQQLMLEDTSMTRYQQLYQSALALHTGGGDGEPDDSSESSNSEDNNFHERKSNESLDAISEDQVKSSSVEVEKLFKSNEKLLDVLNKRTKSPHGSSNVLDKTHNLDGPSVQQNLSLLTNNLDMTNTTLSDSAIRTYDLDSDNETANNKEIGTLDPKKESVNRNDSERKTHDSNKKATVESTKRDDLVTAIEPKLTVKRGRTNRESFIPAISSSSSTGSGRGESGSKTAKERKVVDGDSVSREQMTFPKDNLASEDLGNIKTEATKASSEKYANVSTSIQTTVTCSMISSAGFSPSQSSIAGSVTSATGNTAAAWRSMPALPPMSPQRMPPVPSLPGAMPYMSSYPHNYYQSLPYAYPQPMQMSYNGYSPNLGAPYPMQSTPFPLPGPPGFMPYMGHMITNQPVPPSSPLRAQGSVTAVVQPAKPGNTDVKTSSSASSTAATQASNKSSAGNTVFTFPNAPYHPPSIYYQGYSLVQPAPPLKPAGYSTHPAQSNTNVSLPAPYSAGLVSNEKSTSNSVAPTAKQSIDKLNEKVQSVSVNEKSTAEHSIDSVRTEETDESVATGSQISAQVYKFLEVFLDKSKELPKEPTNHESNDKTDMKNNYEVKVNKEEVEMPNVEKNNTTTVKPAEKEANKPTVDTDCTKTAIDANETAVNFEQDNISQLLSGFLGNLTESSSKNMRNAPKTKAPRAPMRKTMVKKKPKPAEPSKKFCLSDILTDFSKLCGENEEPEVNLNQDIDSDGEDDDRLMANKKTAFPMSRSNQCARKMGHGHERSRTSSERSSESASSKRSQQSIESNSCKTMKTKQVPPKRSVVHIVNTRVKDESAQASSEASSSGWTEVVRRNLAIKCTTATSVPVSQSGPRSCGQRLLDHLMARFPSESTENLTALVRGVRKRHGSRLTGLSFDLIETEVRLQLTRSQLRAADQDSASSGWEKFKGRAWGHTKAAQPAPWQSSGQEECVICFFQLGMRTTVLACQHVFHTECIKKWLKEKSVCPCCQKFTTLNEEYPPL